MAIRDRIARLRAPRNTRDTSSPWWVNATTSTGRPVVLAAALAMSAPAEYHLARTAGFGDPYAYGMPLVLSSYAGIAAVVAANRPKGSRGRVSAIAGAGLALGLAMAAQIVGHWLTTGHMNGDSATLVAIVSAVPPLVVGHLLHLAATRAEDAEQDATEPVETPEPERGPVPTPAEAPPVIPASVRMLATATPCGTRPAEQDTQDDRELISSNEVALLLGVDPSTVRNWVSRGQLTVARKDARGRNLFDPLTLPQPRRRVGDPAQHPPPVAPRDGRQPPSTPAAPGP